MSRCRSRALTIVRDAATVALAVSLHGPAAPFVLTQRET